VASDQLNCGGDTESPSSSRLRATDSAYQVRSGAVDLAAEYCTRYLVVAGML
jgi:hypothetical protein